MPTKNKLTTQDTSAAQGNVSLVCRTMKVTTQVNLEGRPSVASHGTHITTMVRSHASGDEDAFYSVALQVAAQEVRQGHQRARDEAQVEPGRS